ncbi:hypothetical protein [Haloarchaeobius sp. HRN-SO-5]
MATKHGTSTSDRADIDEPRTRGVGMAHVTVVPTNFESEDR